MTARSRLLLTSNTSELVSNRLTVNLICNSGFHINRFVGGYLRHGMELESGGEISALITTVNSW